MKATEFAFSLHNEDSYHVLSSPVQDEHEMLVNNQEKPPCSLSNNTIAWAAHKKKRAVIAYCLEE